LVKKLIIGKRVARDKNSAKFKAVLKFKIPDRNPGNVSHWGPMSGSRYSQEKLQGKNITELYCSAEISETSFLEYASEVISDGNCGVGWMSVTAEPAPIVARMFQSSISAPFSGI
jgi:hypothetical protein